MIVTFFVSHNIGNIMRIVRNIIFFSTFIFMLFLASCTSLSDNAAQEKNISKKIISQIGALGGAIIGSVIEQETSKGKYQQIAIVTGATIGAISGSLLLDYLTENDKQKAEEAFEKSLSGSQNDEVVFWNNPESGNSGTVKSSKKNIDNSNTMEECREFIQTVKVKDKVDKIIGKACRNLDEQWVVI